VAAGDAWIVDAVRTPRGKGRPDGALHDVHPQELLAQCLLALVDRVGFDPAEVDDVIAGNGILTGDHDAVGRLAVLLAGWPSSVPGLTVNRFCGSGQQAVTLAAMGVASGYQDLVVAGGVESMSRWGVAAGSSTIDGGNPDFRSRFPTVPQGTSADLIATLEGFSREDVDAFAVESQRRVAVAVDEGRFERSLVPVNRGGRLGSAGCG
jgi:acetyl-CoA C-acetyltransferase